MAEKLRLLSLFAGIGGFELGLERSGYFETVAQCEIDPFCRRILAKHWPNVRRYEDVRELTAARLVADGIAVDAICGGFPCQPFSTASRGRRAAQDFWPEMLRICAAVAPRVIFAENVQRHPIEIAERQLREIGYTTNVRRICAGEIGADHKRSRWWICAHTNQNCKLYSDINAEVARMSALRECVWGWGNFATTLRVSDGVSNRVDRVGSLGNAVVPQIPELLGRAYGQAMLERA